MAACKESRSLLGTGRSSGLVLATVTVSGRNALFTPERRGKSLFTRYLLRVPVASRVNLKLPKDVWKSSAIIITFSIQFTCLLLTERSRTVGKQRKRKSQISACCSASPFGSPKRKRDNMRGDEVRVESLTLIRMVEGIVGIPQSRKHAFVTVAFETIERQCLSTVAGS